jgi:hypothetical protein
MKLLSNDLNLDSLGHCRADNHTDEILSHGGKNYNNLNQGEICFFFCMGTTVQYLLCVTCIE